MAAKLVYIILCIVGLVEFYFRYDDLAAFLKSPRTKHKLIESKNTERLKAHTAKQWPKKEVVKVDENCWVAIGFGISNSILIEGEDGLIIIDTMETMEPARAVMKEFRKISKKPVKGVIYTHYHTDHTNGVRAIIEDAGPDVQIWSHSSTLSYLRKFYKNGYIGDIRARRQFGLEISSDDFINAGIGPRLLWNENYTPGLIYPTHVFEGNHAKIEIAGVELELFLAPGETPDQIFVWYPSKKIAFPGDNIYETFPNLYALRGSASRNAAVWAKSLNLLKGMGAEKLVPSHTRPILGKQNVYDTLEAYADAIQFVFDQTKRLIFQGLPPDEIVERVVLPDHLRKHPYLQEFYGTVEWSVRSIFSGELGWFSGQAADIHQYSRAERGKRLVDLAGGLANAEKEAEKAFASRDFVWALDLCTCILKAFPKASQTCKNLQVKAMRAQAGMESSPNGRNWYLTAALEAEGYLDNVPILNSVRASSVNVLIDDLLLILGTLFAPERCGENDRLLALTITGEPDREGVPREFTRGLSYVMHHRNGISALEKVKTFDNLRREPDIDVTITTTLFRKFVKQNVSAADIAKMVTGSEDLMFKKGGLLQMRNFFNCYDKLRYRTASLSRDRNDEL